MATNDNIAKRDNRVWLSLRKRLIPLRDKLRKFYEDEDIYAEGLITLGRKHSCLPDLSEENGLQMDMHLHGSLEPERAEVGAPKGG
jgi:hypothetical protein